jgi:hypothetical protein
MKGKDNRVSNLSKRQAYVFREYQRILSATGLNAELVFEFLEDDPEAVVPVLKSMTDQVVRSEVVSTYTMIDMELNFVLAHHFFGTGKKFTAARRTKRYKTLELVLQEIYPIQKLSIVRSFKNVPKTIVSKIAAINDLRNGLAHTFDLTNLKATKRTYKGHNIFTRKGIEVFREDALEIQYFFMPFLKGLFEEKEQGRV